MVNPLMSTLPIFSELSTSPLQKKNILLINSKENQPLVCELKALFPNCSQFEGSTSCAVIVCFKIQLPLAVVY